MDGFADLTLRDQFGNPAGLDPGAEGIQIVIVVSARRLRRIRPWEEALWAYDPTLTVLRVADVPRTAPTEYESVASRLRKRLPEDVRVLIDLEGVWAQRFELDASAPTLLIFGPGGELLARHHGMHSQARFETLRADLDAFTNGS